MARQNQEWLSGNAARNFPFSAPGIPRGFVLDMVAVPDPNPPVRGAARASVSAVRFSDSLQEWEIDLEFPDQGLSDMLSFPADGAGPGHPETSWIRSFGNLCSVALVPGPDWFSPSGKFPEGADPGDLELSLWPHVPVEASRVRGGPDRFLGFLVDSEALQDPPLVPEKIVAGWNVSISPAEGGVSLSVVPEAGEGRVPCPEQECDRPVLRINGAGPLPSGELSLSGEDCVRTELVSLGGRTGAKLASDCVPCCDCVDYRNAARAISRQSAKLGDVRDQLENSLKSSEAEYNAAVAALNDQVPGLVTVHSLEVLPHRISFLVQNNTKTHLYGVVSAFVPEGSEADLEVSEGVMEGIQTDFPPLKGISSTGSDTGIVDPGGSEGWEEGPIVATVGSGQDFDPIPPGGRTRMAISFPSVEALVDSMKSCCSALDLVFDKLGSRTVHPLFDGDDELQGYIPGMTEPSGLSADDGWSGEEDFEQVSGYWIIDGIPSGTVRSWCESAPRDEDYVYQHVLWTSGPPGGSEWSRWLGLDPAPVHGESAYLLGSPAPSRHLYLDRGTLASLGASDPDAGDVVALSLRFCDDFLSGATSPPARNSVRILARRVELALECMPPEVLEGPLTGLLWEAKTIKMSDLDSMDDDMASEMLFQIQRIADEASEIARERMWEELDGILPWQQVDPLRVVATAIYGDAVFACKAFEAVFSTDPFSDSRGRDHLCVEAVVAMMSQED